MQGFRVMVKQNRSKICGKKRDLLLLFRFFFKGCNIEVLLRELPRLSTRFMAPLILLKSRLKKKWDLFLESDNLKLIITTDTFIFGNKVLLPFYREVPQQKKRMLGKTPLLLLPDFGLYYKNPHLKRSLWNMLCNTINSLPSS